MAWPPHALSTLRQKLAILYPTVEEQRTLLSEVGFSEVDLTKIGFLPASLYSWNAIVTWASPRPGKLDAIVARLKQDLPEDTEVQSLDQAMAAPQVSAPVLGPGAWRGAPGLEKILGAQSTLVPIRTLALALDRARSVCRVQLAGSGYGTGFLVRGLTGDLLLTCHHVLPSTDVAAAATVTFNYEEDGEGKVTEPDVWSLDTSVFHTSPVVDGDDWTAVAVKPRMIGGEERRASERWGTLALAPVGVAPQDRVNIIQHPSGFPKKVACVANLVAWVGNDRVQYLTDTEPGSSGSPVFDQQWRVVALHHAGGDLSVGGTGTFALRNEGIAITAIHRVLSGLGVV